MNRGYQLVRWWDWVGGRNALRPDVAQLQWDLERICLTKEHSSWDSRKQDYSDKERTTVLQGLRDMYVLLAPQHPWCPSRLSLNRALGLGATGSLTGDIYVLQRRASFGGMGGWYGLPKAGPYRKQGVLKTFVSKWREGPFLRSLSPWWTWKNSNCHLRVKFRVKNPTAEWGAEALTLCPCQMCNRVCKDSFLEYFCYFFFNNFAVDSFICWIGWGIDRRIRKGVRAGRGKAMDKGEERAAFPIPC